MPLDNLCPGGIRWILQKWLAWHDAAGTPYPLPQDLIQQLEEQLEQEHQRAEQERQRAEQTEQALEQERQRAEVERQRAEQEYERAEQERLDKLRLLERLRQLGVDLEPS
jgi:hypothetical protein